MLTTVSAFQCVITTSMLRLAADETLLLETNLRWFACSLKKKVSRKLGDSTRARREYSNGSNSYLLSRWWRRRFLHQNSSRSTPSRSSCQVIIISLTTLLFLLFANRCRLFAFCQSVWVLRRVFARARHCKWETARNLHLADVKDDDN